MADGRSVSFASGGGSTFSGTKTTSRRVESCAEPEALGLRRRRLYRRRLAEAAELAAKLLLGRNVIRNARANVD